MSLAGSSTLNAEFLYLKEKGGTLAGAETSPPAGERARLLTDGESRRLEGEASALRVAELEMEVRVLTAAVQKEASGRAKLEEAQRHVAELSGQLASEQAKVAGLAQVEIDFTAEYFDYYAGWARIYEAGEIISSDDPNEHIYLHKIPLGVSVCVEIKILRRVSTPLTRRLLDGVAMWFITARSSQHGRVFGCTRLTG